MDLKLGVIGYGQRAKGIIDEIMIFDLGVRLSAVADLKIEEKKKLLKENKYDIDEINFYEDADKMLENENLDGVVVGTRCSLHADMALKVISKKIPLFLEKPIATNMKDLISLRDIKDKEKIVVSFPLRLTPIVKIAKEIIDSGKIGTVEHIQAINNVPYGGVYYHHWYREEKETGGLFLQKATHDFDYINYLAGAKPIEICAMTSKQVFKGNKPAGLRCRNCGESESCRESKFYRKHFSDENHPFDDYCCFGVDTGNEDSGSALIKYETGMHASYSQNFFARKKAAKRGATLIGYKGTIDFDWHKDEVKVYMHTSPREETYKVDSSSRSHCGGDSALAYNFINVMRGTDISRSPFDAGVLSVLMCLKAKKSADKKRFEKIKWPDC